MLPALPSCHRTPAPAGPFPTGAACPAGLVSAQASAALCSRVFSAELRIRSVLSSPRAAGTAALCSHVSSSASLWLADLGSWSCAPVCGDPAVLWSRAGCWVRSQPCAGAGPEPRFGVAAGVLSGGHRGAEPRADPRARGLCQPPSPLCPSVKELPCHRVSSLFFLALLFGFQDWTAGSLCSVLFFSPSTFLDS